MQLIGVEIENFAAFQKQFVPLRDGINVLVGENNTGKTALLRAISALGNLPVGTSPSGRAIPPLAAYCHQKDFPSFVARVIVRLEAGDPSILTLEAVWDRLAIGATASFEFKVWAANGTVDFRRALVTLEGRQLEFYVARDDGFHRRIFDAHRFENFQMDVLPSARYGTPQGNTVAAIPSGLPYFAWAKSFADICSIDSHRRTESNLPLAANNSLPRNASSLATFLDTLQGNDPETFGRIKKVIVDAFPEFRHLIVYKHEGNVNLSFQLSTGERIPLVNCGTGVEQFLALATFVLTAKSRSIILMDEPHAYLHPRAERNLIRFLESHPEHKYVVATHSTVMVNGVAPNRITFVRPPGSPFKESDESLDVDMFLRMLGYRNSDFFFYDKIVMVEGDADVLIISQLFKDKIAQMDEAINIVPLDGVPEKPKLEDLQLYLRKFQKMLDAAGYSTKNCLYLLDGYR
jgi:ABC-type transport system involved in cytochrome c biogenesis ATPase subunit